MTVLPPLSIGLQARRDGASAATSRTQEATAITAIASRTKTPPKTNRSLAPIPPCRRRLRRVRWVIDQRVLRPLSRSGDGVFGRVVVDDPFGQELVRDHHGAAVAGVDVGVGEGDVGDSPLPLFEAD